MDIAVAHYKREIVDYESISNDCKSRYGILLSFHRGEIKNAEVADEELFSKSGVTLRSVVSKYNRRIK